MHAPASRASKRGFLSRPDQHQNKHRRQQQPDKADHDGPHVRGLRPQRNGIAVVGSDDLHAGSPKSHLHFVAASIRKVQSGLRNGFGPGDHVVQTQSLAPGRYSSAVAQSFRRTLPLRHVVGDHAGRFHRCLAELGVARDLALNALSFGMQEVAQAFEF